MLTLDTTEEIQEYGCMALINLTADELNNKIRVKNNGGVMAIVCCLQNFHNCSDIVLSALKTLGNIIELDEVCRQLVDEGGLKTIVNIASRYKDNGDIQLFAAMVLSGLSEIKDLGSDVIHTVDAALMSICSLDDPHLSMYACQAMENLLNTERGPRTFTDEKRLDVILKMMKDFSDHPEIIRVCCKIIAMLALVEDIKKEIPYQAVSMVIESLKNFVQLDDLQIVGCGALSSLSENNKTLAQSIVENDGVGVLASALERHQSEERVHVVVMITLANLLPIDKEKHGTACETAASLIEQSMSMFPEIVAVQVAACEAIAKFRIADLPDPSVLIDSLKHVLRRHKDKSELMKPAAAALRIFWQDGYRKEADEILECTPALKSVFLSTEIDEK
ncbi:protein aardvark-like [Gigantopelta aegis]|uniref:protein aardvark-like n=1 Tax=Gigantopelta aegis TaxID=1735272 RepID=UPI001B887A95|nr:protein aardvark-like [Gigantopelta aegis]